MKNQEAAMFDNRTAKIVLFHATVGIILAVLLWTIQTHARVETKPSYSISPKCTWTLMEQYDKPEEYINIQIRNTWLLMNLLLEEECSPTGEFSGHWIYRIRLSDESQIDTDHTFYFYIYANGYSLNSKNYLLSVPEQMSGYIETLNFEYQMYKDGFIKRYDENVIVPYGATYGKREELCDK